MRAVAGKRALAALVVVATLAVAAIASAASSPSDRFKTPGAPAFPLAYRGFLWVAAHRGGEIYKIDPRRNRIVHTYQTHEASGYLEGFGNRIASIGEGGPAFKVLNIRTGRMRSFGPGPRFVIPHPIEGVAYWGNLDYAGSEWTFNGSVARRDPKTRVVLKRWRGIDLEGTGMVIAGGSIWIPGLTTVARIDPKDDTATIIPLPGGLANPGNKQGYAVVERAAVTPGTVWVTNPAGLYRIDEHTNTAKLVPGISVGNLDEWGYIDLVAAKGSLFMRNGPNSVVRIDPATEKITATYPASGGGGGIDVGFDSLWVTNFISDTTWRNPLG